MANSQPRRCGTVIEDVKRLISSFLLLTSYFLHSRSYIHVLHLRPQQYGHRRAEKRANDRDPRVAPIAVALAGNRQDSMGYPRAQIAGRVNGVARRPAQRQANRQNQKTDRQRRACPIRFSSPGIAGSTLSPLIIDGDTAINTANTSTNVPMTSLNKLLSGLRIAGPVANVASFASGSSTRRSGRDRR